MKKMVMATRSGALDRSLAAGALLFLCGCVLALIGVFIQPLGLLLFLPDGWLVYKGSRAAVGTHRVCCPFCGEAGFLAADQRVYRCRCGRKSVKDEAYLFPVFNQK